MEHGKEQRSEELIESNLENYEQLDDVKEMLIDMFLKHEQDQIIFICIGTDQSTGDSFGPFVGKYLTESEFSFPVYGTIEHPVDALNLKQVLEMVKIKYDNPIIVAIDASVANERHIGKIFFKQGALRPGKYAMKILPLVGDYHLSAVVNVRDSIIRLKKLHETRLHFILQLSLKVASLILEANYLAKTINDK